MGLDETFSKKQLDPQTPFYITGGAGFIGSNLVHALNKMGCNNLYIVDDLGSDPHKWRYLVGASFIEITSIQEFKDRLEKEKILHGCVVHLGAISDTSEKNADKLLKENLEFSIKLYSAFLNGGCENCAFVYASSASTYGLGENGFDDDESKLDSLKPINPYGFSKHLFDLYLKKRRFNKAIGLKYFNVFGPNEYHKAHMSSMILKNFDKFFNSQSLHKNEIQLFKSVRLEIKDAEQARDFIYIDDAIEQTLWHIFNPKHTGIFNCGSGVATSWWDLAENIIRVRGVGDSSNIKYVESSIKKSLYQPYSLANLSKARGLGYKHMPLSIDKALDEYYKKYLEYTQ